MKSANDLTQGVIWKQLVKYSLPLIATSVMQSLYSLFDILIAGRFLGSAGISGQQFAGVGNCEYGCNRSVYGRNNTYRQTVRSR